MDLFPKTWSTGGDIVREYMQLCKSLNVVNFVGLKMHLEMHWKTDFCAVSGTNNSKEALVRAWSKVQDAFDIAVAMETSLQDAPISVNKINLQQTLQRDKNCNHHQSYPFPEFFRSYSKLHKR